MGFPRGSVVKNSPANAKDAGSISDPGRSHMWQRKEQQSPCATTAEAQAP